MDDRKRRRRKRDCRSHSSTSHLPSGTGTACRGPLLLDSAEANKNFYFRNGDREHTFEAAQSHIQDWVGKSEAQVLLQRVKDEVKPVATIVDPGDEIIKTIQNDEALTHAYGKNTRGVQVMVFTATPDLTLMDLLQAREDKGLVEKNWLANDDVVAKLRDRRVRYYIVEGGFDMSMPLFVNVLESALLLGYPLDLAGEMQNPGMVDRRR